MDETVVSVGDADVKRKPSWTLMLRLLCRVCCWLRCRQMRWRQQFPVFWNTEETSFFCEPCEREKDGDHGAEIVPQDLSRLVPPLTIKTVHHLGQKLYVQRFTNGRVEQLQFPAFSSLISSSGDVAVCAAMNRKKVTIVSCEVFALLSGLTQRSVCNGDRCVCSFTQMT